MSESIEALRRELEEDKQKARVLRVENTTVRMELAAMTAERDELERLYGSEFNLNNELIGVRARLLDSLVASQAREQQLRKALDAMVKSAAGMNCGLKIADDALALPHDDTALRQYGAKLLRDAATWFDEHETDSAMHLRRMANELSHE